MSNRGPYRPRNAKGIAKLGRPSEVLVENLRAYRSLRQITQEDLALRMHQLGHAWGRSTVSAVEGKGRHVTIDELFGLAISFGTTIGHLLDPTGPDHTRGLSLDVGLTAENGTRRPIAPRVAHLWAASRAVVRLRREDSRGIEVHAADDIPVEARRELEGLPAGG